MKEYVLELIEQEDYCGLALYAYRTRNSLYLKREIKFANVIEEITGINCNANNASASYNVLIKFLIEKEKK